MGRVSGRECAEWQGIMAMDAIGRASADESRELAEHLEQCETCRGDAADVRSAAGALSLLDIARVDALDRETESPAPAPLALSSSPEADVPETLWSAPATPPVARPMPAPPSVDVPDGVERRTRRRRMAGVGVAVGAVAAAVVAVLLVTGPPSAPTTKVALTGQPGVEATVSLTTTSWGTQGTLVESGQVAGQVLSVWMRDASGHWWVAGSYRTTGRSGKLEVPLSCAVQSGQITNVYVRDGAGRAVLSGYVS